MTIDELLSELQVIKTNHGGDVTVTLSDFKGRIEQFKDINLVEFEGSIVIIS